MDADTDNNPASIIFFPYLVRECKKCNQKHKNLPRLEPHLWEEPLHRGIQYIDLFGPINGNYFLIAAVDAFSKELEVFPTKNNTSD